MAKIVGGIGEGLRGSLGDLSFYKMRGVEDTIVRTKGGFTKERIKTDPKLERLRLAESEFGGRAKAGKYIMQALMFQKPMADYNIAGPLTKLLLPVQELASEGPLGKRGILLSMYPHVIKGFSLNKNNTLDTVIRYPLTCSLSRETASAIVNIPELVPDINFFVPAPVKYPYYRICISLGLVPDVVYKESGYMPTHVDYMDIKPRAVYTEWFPRLQGSPAQVLTVQYERLPPDTHFTLLLAAGIEYGELLGVNNIQRAPYVGCAKVLEVG
jgi:hypothetical protein